MYARARRKAKRAAVCQSMSPPSVYGMASTTSSGWTYCLYVPSVKKLGTVCDPWYVGSIARVGDRGERATAAIAYRVHAHRPDAPATQIAVRIASDMNMYSGKRSGV